MPRSSGQIFFFFKQKTAYEIDMRLEFRRVLFRSTAEGIRTALYFGLACGRELRAVLESRLSREQALRRYAAFSAAHARKYRWLLAAQRAVGLLTTTRAVPALARLLERP